MRSSEMPRIYLDNCCFNRPYDNQNDINIHLETEAKLYLQGQIKRGYYELVWRYILEYENSNNPNIENRGLIADWSKLSVENVSASNGLLQKAEQLLGLGIDQYDALHIAAASEAKCDIFVTTDKSILKRIPAFKGMKVLNPIEVVREERVE